MATFFLRSVHGYSLNEAGFVAPEVERVFLSERNQSGAMADGARADEVRRSQMARAWPRAAQP